MPPLEMVRRPFISSRAVSQPALRVSPPPPVVLPLVAVVELEAPPAPSEVPVDDPGPPNPLGPGPPVDDIPPEVEPIPPLLDELLEAAPVVLLTADEPEVVLEEPDAALVELVVALVELVVALVELVVALAAVVPSALLSSAGAGSLTSVAHARSSMLETESAPTETPCLIPIGIEAAQPVVGAK